MAKYYKTDQVVYNSLFKIIVCQCVVQNRADFCRSVSMVLWAMFLLLSIWGLFIFVCDMR